ncbi:MAG: hypothetical protein RLZZ25_649 [Gemmatimonadota bacterium]|jgi:hypothetical protein
MRGIGRAVRGFGVALLLVGGASIARAQSIEIQLPPATRLTDDGPLVSARGILSDRYLSELVRNGFPARLRFRVELWAEARLVDALQRAVEWEVLVRPRGTDDRYEVVQLVGGRPLSLGAFARLEDADATVARPVRAPIEPGPDGRRRYYVARVEVAALSVTDLDEVNRWLRGELQPAVRGERNPGTALSRGIRTVATRLLGGERRSYEARSAGFRASSRTTPSP